MTIKSELSAELNEPIELTDAEVAAVAGGLLNFSNSLTNFGNVSNSANNAVNNASGTNSTAVGGIAAALIV